MFGVWPIATNSPPHSKSSSTPVVSDLRRTPVTKSPPSTSTTAVFQRTRILGFSSARFAITCDARNESRRCTITTSLANLVR